MWREIITITIISVIIIIIMNEEQGVFCAP